MKAEITVASLVGSMKESLSTHWRDYFSCALIGAALYTLAQAILMGLAAALFGPFSLALFGPLTQTLLLGLYLSAMQLIALKLTRSENFKIADMKYVIDPKRAFSIWIISALASAIIFIPAFIGAFILGLGGLGATVGGAPDYQSGFQTAISAVIVGSIIMIVLLALTIFLSLWYQLIYLFAIDGEASPWEALESSRKFFFERPKLYSLFFLGLYLLALPCAAIGALFSFIPLVGFLAWIALFAFLSAIHALGVAALYDRSTQNSRLNPIELDAPSTG